MSEFHAPYQNHLLNKLPEADYQRLFPYLELVQMPLGAVLNVLNDKMCHAYFPTTSIVSLLYDLEDGSSSQIAVIGNEGILGAAIFMGGSSLPNRAVVMSAGYGYRLKRQQLMQEFNRAEGLQELLLHYTQALITQIAQNAVCNRRHSLDQQFCRFLLQSLDRLIGSELNMTQELIAHLLGVRREGVTETVGKLKKAELIECTRGHIKVLNRSGLEKRVCECYQVVKTEYDRLLPYASMAPNSSPIHGPHHFDVHALPVPGIVYHSIRIPSELH